LFGPIIGAALVVIVKSVVSGYIERWNILLGAIFVAIVIMMPEGLVPGTARLVTRHFSRGGDKAGKKSVAVGPGH
jgi:branched-chain amino acid transport system permease protein